MIGQTYSLIEYILIDGGSTDSTMSIVQRYGEHIAYYTSEPDRNMYDAINKGLSQATGDYIMVLNSDDELMSDGCIAEVAAFIARVTADVYVTNLVTDYGNGRVKPRRHYPVKFRRLLAAGDSTFLPHPSLIVSKKINERLSGYDISYNYASDYDYILRMLALPRVNIAMIPIYTTRFRMHPGSITASGRINKERLSILEKHGYDGYSGIVTIFLRMTGWIKYLVLNLDNYWRFYTRKSIE